MLLTVSTSVFADDIISLPTAETTRNKIAALETGRNRGIRNAVRSRGASAAAPTDEKSLSAALELPSSEIYVASESKDGFEEFELKIPDYDLPESDIPLTVNSKVEYFINFFQTSGRTWFAKWLSRSERYLPMMKEVLKREGLPEDLVYLAMIESGFSPHAYSRASAVGPWQFIAGTGKRYSLRIDSWIDERRDPLKSTVAAAMYLKELYGLFNKDWYLAAAGYNAGENKILRAIDMYNSRDYWQLSQGGYLKRETKDYVPKLLAAAIIAKDPAKYGFADIAYLPPIEFDTVQIPVRTDLELVARLTGTNYETIRDLNPELRRWCTPPDYPGYELKIPKGKREVFLREYSGIPDGRKFTEKVSFSRYRAKRSDTIDSIALRFGVAAEEIARANKLDGAKKVRGRLLLIPLKSETVASEAPKAPVAQVKEKEIIQYYTVRRGDTLSSVAKRFNVSTKIIAAWNNLKGKISLKPGKKIIVAKIAEKKDKNAVRTDENG